MHNNSHGCLKAHFIVRDLEKQNRWGILREPRTYPAWIRFSSGDSSYLPDAKWDAWSAIKLMGVEGDKLLSSQRRELTQDFIMMNNPNYFIRKLEDYVQLTIRHKISSARDCPLIPGILCLSIAHWASSIAFARHSTKK